VFWLTEVFISNTLFLSENFAEFLSRYWIVFFQLPLFSLVIQQSIHICFEFIALFKFFFNFLSRNTFHLISLPSVTREIWIFGQCVVLLFHISSLCWSLHICCFYVSTFLGNSLYFMLCPGYWCVCMCVVLSLTINGLFTVFYLWLLSCN
jgi:hypothetical protein